MRRLPLLVLAALWSCSKPAEEYKEERSSFQLTSERIGYEEPCSRLIPGEWSPSFPVPSLHGGRLAYRVFFSGWSGRPGAITLYDAQGDAAFTPEGKVLECAQRPGDRKALPAWTMPENFTTRVRALYGSIEELGRLYARGMPIGDADRARVGAFSREFAALTGPSFASYRSLSPEFWAWVEKNGGAAPR